VIVDCHMHVKGGDLYRREFSANFIVRRLDEAGIDKAVVFSICLGSRESNDLTYREVQTFPDRLIGFAHVNPEEGDLTVALRFILGSSPFLRKSFFRSWMRLLGLKFRV